MRAGDVDGLKGGSSNEEDVVSCAASLKNAHGSLPRLHHGFGFGSRLGAGSRGREKMEDKAEDVSRVEGGRVIRTVGEDT